MNKFANNYIDEVLAQMALKGQVSADRPVRSAIGGFLGGAAAGSIAAPLTALSGGALAPVSALIGQTGSRVGGRLAAGGSDPEESGQVIGDSADALKNMGYGQLVKRQMSKNLKKNFLMDVPLGTLGGATLGFLIGKSRGSNPLASALAGAAIGGVGTTAVTQAGNVLGPTVRKLMANVAGPGAIDKANDFYTNRPVVSSLPFSTLIAPLAAKEFTQKKEKKEANEFLDKIVNSIKSYRPFDPVQSVAAGIPAGALLGAAIGGTRAGIRDMEYDRDGQKKSRYKEILKGMLLGGTVGGLGAAALPSLAQSANAAATSISNAGKGWNNDPIGKLMNSAGGAITSAVLPTLEVKDLPGVAMDAMNRR